MREDNNTHKNCTHNKTITDSTQKHCFATRHIRNDESAIDMAIGKVCKHRLYRWIMDRERKAWSALHWLTYAQGQEASLSPNNGVRFSRTEPKNMCSRLQNGRRGPLLINGDEMRKHAPMLNTRDRKNVRIIADLLNVEQRRVSVRFFAKIVLGRCCETFKVRCHRVEN